MSSKIGFKSFSQKLKTSLQSLPDTTASSNFSRSPVLVSNYGFMAPGTKMGQNHSSSQGQEWSDSKGSLSEHNWVIDRKSRQKQIAKTMAIFHQILLHSSKRLWISLLLTIKIGNCKDMMIHLETPYSKKS